MKQNYQVFSDVDWLYPDTEITEPSNTATLHSARGADVCFQVITDIKVDGSEDFSVDAVGIGASVKAYQLASIPVSSNSGPNSLSTNDYELVKHFVTKKAPFEVYDETFELNTTLVKAGRAAFYIRIDVPSDAVVGERNGKIILTFGDNSIEIPVNLTVYNVVVPTLDKAAFHMVNWIYYDFLAGQFGVEAYSDEYMKILHNYLDNQLDMRNDFLMLPIGEPIKDADGKIIDFDFSKAELIGNIALEKGFTHIMGGFIAHWSHWTEPEIYLIWDRSIDCSSVEGYRQLKLYFKRAYECLTRNNWGDKYMQCLVDEPQFPSAMSYRALSGICRQNMPGIKINDPVETTDIEGAIDIWAIKQTIYEKYIEDFQKIQACGDEMWLYSCGFPAGKTMNRVMDLSLTVSRLTMWMCFKYNCPGFLHWGYHFSAKPSADGSIDGCTPVPSDSNKKYPPGNGHIVYPFANTAVYSVRGHAQRTGAIDYELFNILAQKDRQSALDIVNSVCTTFSEYDPRSKAFNNARIKLLKTLG